MSDEAAPEVEEKEKKGKGVLIAVVAVFVVLQAVVTFFIVQKTVFSKNTEGAEASQEEILEEAADEPGLTFPLENLIVNPAGCNGLRFVKISMILETYEEDVIAELEVRTYRINDILIRLLSSKSIEDLDSGWKRDSLKTEMIEAVNGQVGEGGVSNIYFTDFIIQ